MKLVWRQETPTEKTWQTECANFTLCVEEDKEAEGHDGGGFWWWVDETGETNEDAYYATSEDAMEAAEQYMEALAYDILNALGK